MPFEAREVGTPRVDVPNLEQHITTRQLGAPVFPSTIEAVRGLIELYGVVSRMHRTRGLELSRNRIDTDEHAQLKEVMEPLTGLRQELRSCLVSIGQQTPVNLIDLEVNPGARRVIQTDPRFRRPEDMWAEDVF